MPKGSIYTVGGTVQAGSGIYIPRKADDILLQLCRDGIFAYVLTARQMGKSSLMVRTAEQLAKSDIVSVIIDLSQFGVHLSAEQWYFGLLTNISEEFDLEVDAIKWWQENNQLGVTQRMVRFFERVLLVEIEKHIVIFIDEIDSTLSLAFTDDFYAAIRSIYNARSTSTVFQRLSFVLLGVATPGDLINDPARTPFNIGQRVTLTDFTFEEAKPLASGLNASPEKSVEILGWILKWTGGHPYLTQRLCNTIVTQQEKLWTETDIDLLVANTFLGEMSGQDVNLQFVRDMLIKRAPSTVGIAGLLETYAEVRQALRPVYDEEQSILKSHLKLSGIVRNDANRLVVRNRIYGEVFDRRWIEEHLPSNLETQKPSERKFPRGVVIPALFILCVVPILISLLTNRIYEQDIQDITPTSLVLEATLTQNTIQGTASARETVAAIFAEYTIVAVTNIAASTATISAANTNIAATNSAVPTATITLNYQLEETATEIMLQRTADAKAATNEAIFAESTHIAETIIAASTSTPSATNTLLPTSSTPQALLLREISVRLGPSSSYPLVGTLSANEQVNIVGISEDGLWYQVALPNRLLGWISGSATLVQTTGDLLIVPVAFAPTNTPTWTPTPSLTPTSTATFKPTLTLTPSQTSTPTPVLCPGSLPSRLIVGQEARVSFGASNRVRSAPTLNSELIGRITPGDTFLILDGPVCAEGFTWYQVEVSSLIGWTAEGDATDYWLEPITTLETATTEANICTVVAEGKVNKRKGPSTSFELVDEMNAGEISVVIGQAISPSGFTWWKLEDNTWVREDTVRVEGICSSVPIAR